MTIEVDVLTQARDFRVAIGSWALGYASKPHAAPQTETPGRDATAALRLWSSRYFLTPRGADLPQSPI